MPFVFIARQSSSVTFYYGLLVWPSGVAFCYSLLVCSGVSFCYGLLVYLTPTPTPICPPPIPQPPTHTHMATEAGDTHPTEKHSC